MNALLTANAPHRGDAMPLLTSPYLDLLKQCLTGRIHDPQRGPEPVSRTDCAALLASANAIFAPWLAPGGDSVESLLVAGTALAPADFAEQLRQSLNGMHRDRTPDTMSDRASLDHLQLCVEQVIDQGIPGDLIETGIWKGGLPVLMRAILKERGIDDRIVWAADSFEGLPQPDPDANLKDAIWHHLFAPLDHLAIPFDFVQDVFRKYGLLDDGVRFLRGWFADTLPKAPISQLALMRLDGDWYDSTRQALAALYPKLAPGGFVIIDDYGLPFGCRRAVDEYRAAYGIAAPMRWVNAQVACWRKPA